MNDLMDAILFNASRLDVEAIERLHHAVDHVGEEAVGGADGPVDAHRHSAQVQLQPQNSSVVTALHYRQTHLPISEYAPKTKLNYKRSFAIVRDQSCASRTKVIIMRMILDRYCYLLFEWVCHQSVSRFESTRQHYFSLPEHSCERRLVYQLCACVTCAQCWAVDEKSYNSIWTMSLLP